MFKATSTVSGEAFSSAWLLSMTSLIGGYSTVAYVLRPTSLCAAPEANPDSRQAQHPRFHSVLEGSRLAIRPGARPTRLVPHHCTFRHRFRFRYQVLQQRCRLVVASRHSRSLGFSRRRLLRLVGLVSRSDVSSVTSVAESQADPSSMFPSSCNVSANSISAANDLATLFPKYINIRRGQIITAILGGWAMAPFKILSSEFSSSQFIEGRGKGLTLPPLQRR